MIETKDLVNMIFKFCEAYAYGNSGKYFFPYQAQLSKRIIRSLLENDGEEITGLQSRQSGKSEVVAITVGGCSIILPILANMPMFLDDPRLKKFKNGFLAGIFAPALHQAQIIFNRVKGYMSTDSALAILSDPDINVTFDVNNGQNIVLRFRNLNITSTITCMSASEGSNIEGKSYMLVVVDESQDVGNMKYSKSISPMCSFYNGTKVLIGTPTTRKGFFYESIERNKRDFATKVRRRNHFEFNYEVVCKYNPDYAKYIAGEKRRLGEDSDEFQMSYNLRWVIERGMFITDANLTKILNDKLGFVYCDTLNEHVVGIDFGKSMDSTVVSVGEVDWENPILVENSKSIDPNIKDFIVYNVTLKAWLELQGDNWNTQYVDIMSFLSNFRIRKIVADATGVGAGIVDRISANMSCEVIPYVFSTPAKSDLYKHFDTEIKAQRIIIPANADVLDTREYQHFAKQMLSLQKGYSGQNMICCHPPEKGAHDDYPDATALMVWGAMGEGVERPVTENGNVFYDEVVKNRMYSVRNRITARRRR
jgi:hypothetical protein